MGYKRRMKVVLIAEQVLEVIKCGRGLVRSGFCCW